MKLSLLLIGSTMAHAVQRRQDSLFDTTGSILGQMMEMIGMPTGSNDPPPPPPVVPDEIPPPAPMTPTPPAASRPQTRDIDQTVNAALAPQAAPVQKTQTAQQQRAPEPTPAPATGRQATQVSNQTPQTSNQTPQTSNQTRQVSNQKPQKSNVHDKGQGGWQTADQQAAAQAFSS